MKLIGLSIITSYYCAYVCILLQYRFSLTNASVQDAAVLKWFPSASSLSLATEQKVNSDQVLLSSAQETNENPQTRNFIDRNKTSRRRRQREHRRQSSPEDHINRPPYDRPVGGDSGGSGFSPTRGSRRTSSNFDNSPPTASNPRHHRLGGSGFSGSSGRGRGYGDEAVRGRGTRGSTGPRTSSANSASPSNYPRRSSSSHGGYANRNNAAANNYSPTSSSHQQSRPPFPTGSPSSASGNSGFGRSPSSSSSSPTGRSSSSFGDQPTMGNPFPGPGRVESIGGEGNSNDDHRAVMRPSSSSLSGAAPRMDNKQQQQQFHQQNGSPKKKEKESSWSDFK